MTRPFREGVLPVDKPVGPTSHDVVAVARRALGLRRVGHTGTLDPFASGLLLLCVGGATRLAEFLTGMDKTYEATALLGVATDSEDRDGQVISRSEAWRLVGYHAWKKDKDLKRAEACFRKALSGRTDDQILYRDLAHILAELDRRPEAIELIESMPDGGETRYDVCLWLAAAYNAQGRYDDSIEFLSKAHFSNWEGSSEPRDIYVEALMARGKRLFEAGRYDQALKDFQTARTYPENLQVGARYKRTDAETCYWLGQTHLVLGNKDQARIAFKEGAVQVSKTGQQFTFIPVSDAQDDHVKQCAAALAELQKTD